MPPPQLLLLLLPLPAPHPHHHRRVRQRRIATTTRRPWRDCCHRTGRCRSSVFTATRCSNRGCAPRSMWRRTPPAIASNGGRRSHRNSLSTVTKHPTNPYDFALAHTHTHTHTHGPV